jgi:uncharacterized membrane protein YfcA
MLSFLLSALAGLLCGVLSGFGVGGGSLLMVWMTAVLGLEQKTAQGVNLLFFLPTAAAALVFHSRSHRVDWRAVWPAALCGCLTAAAGAFLALGVESCVLRKLFGGFLIPVGILEIRRGIKKERRKK